MLKIIDTNILLDFPQIIEKEEDLVIIVEVLRELDGLKLNQNQDTAFKARRAAVVLSHHLDKIKWIDKYEEVKENVDDKLLLCTKEMNGILITNDVYLKVKATIKGIQTKGWGGGEEYSGVRTIYLETDENRFHRDLEYIMTEKKLPRDDIQLNENEFVIIKDLGAPITNKHGEKDYEVLALFVQKNGQLERFDSKGIENKWIRYIMPRNAEQACLFKALQDNNNTIIYAGGSFGTG